MFDPEESGPAEIPDYDHIEDEAFPPLPPPHSPGQGGGEEADPFGNGEEDGEVSRLEEVPAAKRKGIRRPQPKLDTHRLISERGLPALRTLFDNVRFKGKGHEAEDLQLLMHKMENWAHRLYPKLQFSDFIDKVEKLGSKKDVQTCLKRIRLDMPLTHDDFISKDDEEEAPGPNVFGDPDPFGGGNFHDDPLGPVHSTPAPAAPAPATPAPTTPSLTEEQRKRMELNRRLALERRMARKQPQQTDPSDSQPADVPSASSSSNLPRQSKDQAEEAKDSDPDRDGAELVEQVPPEDPGLSPDSPQGGQREPGFSSVPQLGTGGEESD